MKYKITHTTKFTYTEAVPVCHNLVHLTPRVLPFQNCLDYRLLVRPEPLDLNRRLDYFGNEVSYFSIDQPHHGLTVTSTSLIEVNSRPQLDLEATPAWESVAKQLNDDRTDELLEAFTHTLDSLNVRQFPGLVEFTKLSFTPQRPIASAVMELTKRINTEFKFDPRATTIHTPIEDVFTNRHGVCQDFAHFQIGCLRSMGLAARYVSGYLRTIPPPGKPRLIGADASHAWLSVYCGPNHGWVDFDPTNNALVGTDYVTVAWGRDYSDVCPIQGVIVGGGEHGMSVAVDVLPVE